jgi:hypothetical protein
MSNGVLYHDIALAMPNGVLYQGTASEAAEKVGFSGCFEGAHL